LILIGPAFNTVSELCLLCGLPDTLIVNLVFSDTECNVFSDGAIGQKNGLRDMSDMSLPATVVTGGEGLSINLECAIGRS
jgi:hypothetical protein